MWHVKDVRDVNLIFFECNAIYVEDVKDRSNTPKGCNAMYVKDVEDGKRTYKHIFAPNFLNIQLIFNPEKVLESWDSGLSNDAIKSYVCWRISKMSKIDQVHLRAVMLFMSETSEIIIIFNKHRIWWYGWKVLSLSFLKLFLDWKSVNY